MIFRSLLCTLAVTALQTIPVAAEPAGGQTAAPTKPGTGFRDCAICPELTVVPAGTYQRGSPDGKPDERPVQQVSIPHALAVGRFEVTFAEWDACVSAGACPPKSDTGWGRGRRPVHGVTWLDARAYTQWLSAQSGQSYRLPSEAEWEYFARAGSQTRYSWGDDIGYGEATCDYCEKGNYETHSTTPVGAHKPNAFGLFDVHGNVWEWTLDCYDADAYEREPSHRPLGTATESCKRVLRGGSWHVYPELLRSARRYRADPKVVYGDVGLRVVRELRD